MKYILLHFEDYRQSSEKNNDEKWEEKVEAGDGGVGEMCYMYYGRGRRENLFALKFVRLWPVALLVKADCKQGRDLGRGKVPTDDGENSLNVQQIRKLNWNCNVVKY